MTDYVRPAVVMPEFYRVKDVKELIHIIQDQMLRQTVVWNCLLNPCYTPEPFYPNDEFEYWREERLVLVRTEQAFTGINEITYVTEKRIDDIFNRMTEYGYRGSWYGLTYLRIPVIKRR